VEAASSTTELDRESLRTAELGFYRLLRRKRISEGFRDKYAEDIFGQAQKEYAGWIAEGNVAQSPVGWLINCAWRRTQDLLGELKRRPPLVSVDEAFHLVDSSTPGPEEQAIDHDIHERLENAMRCLPAKERKLLELVYFEDFDVFAAGRELGWAKSSSHRHHDAALERLRAIVPDDLDALGVEIGLAAWVAIAGGATRGWELPRPFEMALHGAHDAAASAAHRLTELWRRLSPAADAGNAPLTGGAARAVGACGAAAVACLATGVIGPGVGGVDFLAHPHAQPKAVSSAKQAPTAAPSQPEAVTPGSPEPTPQATPRPTRGSSSPAKKGSASTARATQQVSAPRTTAEQTRQEFGIESTSGTPVRSSSGGSSSSGSGSSGSSGSSSSGSGSSGGSTSHSSSSANSEFGL
jgi:DNA-directed RNA polymerase specialized sigma24 family protein